MEKNKIGRCDVWTENKMALLDSSNGWEPNIPVGLALLKNKMLSAKTQIRKRWIWLGVSVGAVCLSTVIFPLPRVFAHRCLQCTVAVWQSLTQLSPPTEHLRPGAERRVAPDFDLKNAQGKSIQLSALKGRVVLVNFWATWCHGCQEEIPSFIKFEKKYEKRGLTVVGISMDDDGWKSVKPWIKERNVNYPIVIGNRDLSQLYGLEGMPLSVLVDREGRIANRRDGIVDATDFDQKIQALLEERAKDSVSQ